MTLELRGCGTALVTPFTPGGEVDLEALRRLAEWQLARGVDFLVPCGSTGEAQTLGAAERRRVIEATVEAVDGKALVVGGVAGNDTARVVEEARAVSGYGVAAVMVVTPYYNKPTPTGLERHFTQVADASARPVLMYTVPGRTAVHLPPESALRLARHPNILGVKDATGDLHWAMTVIRGRPEGFQVLSGEDGLVLPHLACGGDGLISVASNVAPGQISELVRAGLAGDFTRARELQLRLLPLIDALFRETNPIPAKAALQLLGRIRNELRLPLVPASPGTVEALRAAMAEAGLKEATVEAGR
jgi:4-hydroxy-tetrahydrodipicolinate synthase